jgi:hypothetical protein
MTSRRVGTSDNPLHLKTGTDTWQLLAGGNGHPLKVKQADGSWRVITTEGYPAVITSAPYTVKPYWYIGAAAQDPRGSRPVPTVYDSAWNIPLKTDLYGTELRTPWATIGYPSNEIFLTQYLYAYEEAIAYYIRNPIELRGKYGGSAAPIQSVIIVDFNTLGDVGDTYPHSSTDKPKGKVSFYLESASLYISSIYNDFPPEYKAEFFSPDLPPFVLTQLDSDPFASLNSTTLPFASVSNGMIAEDNSIYEGYPPEESGNFFYQNFWGKETRISTIAWAGDYVTNGNNWKRYINPMLDGSTTFFGGSTQVVRANILETGTLLEQFEFGPGIFEPEGNYLVFSLITKNQEYDESYRFPSNETAPTLKPPGEIPEVFTEFNEWIAHRELVVRVVVEDLEWISI